MKLLAELHDILDKKRPGYTAILAPGINEQEVNKILTERNVSLSLPEQALAWFDWKNGIDREAFENSPGNHYSNIEAFQSPVSLQESIKEYFSTQKLELYPRHLFPLLTNWGGNIYLVNTDANSPDYQCVFGFSKDRLNVLKAFTSVNSMILSIIESYRKNILFTADAGRLDVDIFALQALYIELNPDCGYWTAE